VIHPSFYHWLPVAASACVRAALRVVVALFAVQAWAGGAKLDETGAFAVRWWTVEDGVPETPVTAIDVASDGAVWCATRTRLARFDGQAFAALDGAETDRLRNQIGDFTGLGFDGRGTLWLVGRLGAAARGIDAVGKAAWSVYPSPDGPLEHVIVDGHGSPRFVGVGRLMDFDGKQLVPRDLLAKSEFDFYAACIEPQSNDMWVWGKGLARRIEAGVARNDAADIAGKIINLAPGPRGVWAGLVDGKAGVVEGAAVFRDGHWTAWPMAERPRTPTREGHILEGPDGTVWLSTHASIHALRDGQWATVVDGLPDFSLTTQRMRTDRQGTLWVACSGGLLALEPTSLRVSPLPPARVLFRRGDGTLVAGLPGEIVLLDEAQDGTLGLGPQVGELPEAALPTAIAETSDGTLFVGTRDSFIYKVRDGEAGVVTQTPGSRLEVRNVHALLCDETDRVWVGTDNGLAVYNVVKKCFDPLPAFTEPTPLPVIGLAAEDDGSLLVAVQGRGIDRLASNGRVTRELPAALMPGKRTVRFCRSAEGTLWAAGDAGLVRWGRDGRKSLFDERQGLVDKAIVALATDDERLWLAFRDGHMQGVRLADLDAAAADPGGVVRGIVLGPLDGLGETELLGGLERVGRHALVATCSRGIVRLDLAAPLRAATTPSAVAVARDDAGEGMRFRYSTVTVDELERPLYQTRLVGVDAAWSVPGPENERVYPAVPSGRHRFEVRHLRGDAVQAFPQGTIDVDVPLPFWRTPWFIALVLLGVAAAAAGVAGWVSRVAARRRIARLEQEHERQRDRARIARDIHDSLGAGLTQMAMMSDLMRRTAGQTGGDAALDDKLDEMYRSAQSLTRAVDEIVWAVNPANDTLRRFCTFVAHDVEDMARSGGLDLQIDVDDDVPDVVVPAAARHHLCMLVREAVANVLKHARATTLTFGLHARDGLLDMTISDDGQGFARGVAVGHDADGLANMQARVDELRGTIEIDSAPAAGTRVRVRVPLGRLSGDGLTHSARPRLRIRAVDDREADNRRTG
jgi:signal transduction histidine kinase/streptogramin lyase